jgi:hypothetical protein
MHYNLAQHLEPLTQQHGVTSKKNGTVINTTVTTSNLTLFITMWQHMEGMSMWSPRKSKLDLNEDS